MSSLISKKTQQFLAQEGNTEKLYSYLIDKDQSKPNPLHDYKQQAQENKKNDRQKCK